MNKAQFLAAAAQYIFFPALAFLFAFSVVAVGNAC